MPPGGGEVQTYRAVRLQLPLLAGEPTPCDGRESRDVRVVPLGGLQLDLNQYNRLSRPVSYHWTMRVSGIE